MATRRTLAVSRQQRQVLAQHRDHDERPYVRERCGGLLKIADGQSPHTVAKTGLLKPRDPDTVYGWLNIYTQEGIGGLMARQHGGNHRRSLRPTSSVESRIA